MLIPFVDRIRYAYSLKEMVIEIPSQSGVTQDNATIHIDGVLYMQVVDPVKVRCVGTKLRLNCTHAIRIEV